MKVTNLSSTKKNYQITEIRISLTTEFSNIENLHLISLSLVISGDISIDEYQLNFMNGLIIVLPTNHVGLGLSLMRYSARNQNKC